MPVLHSGETEVAAIVKKKKKWRLLGDGKNAQDRKDKGIHGSSSSALLRTFYIFFVWLFFSMHMYLQFCTFIVECFAFSMVWVNHLTPAKNRLHSYWSLHLTPKCPKWTSASTFSYLEMITDAFLSTQLANCYSLHLSQQIFTGQHMSKCHKWTHITTILTSLHWFNHDQQSPTVKQPHTWQIPGPSTVLSGHCDWLKVFFSLSHTQLIEALKLICLVLHSCNNI